MAFARKLYLDHSFNAMTVKKYCTVISQIKICEIIFDRSLLTSFASEKSLYTMKNKKCFAPVDLSKARVLKAYF